MYALRVFQICHVLLSIDRTELHSLLLSDTFLLRYPFPLLILPYVVCPPSYNERLIVVFGKRREVVREYVPRSIQNCTKARTAQAMSAGT